MIGRRAAHRAQTGDNYIVVIGHCVMRVIIGERMVGTLDGCKEWVRKCEEFECQENSVLSINHDAKKAPHPAMGKTVKRGESFSSSFLFSLKAVFVFSGFLFFSKFGSPSPAVLRLQ